MFNQQRGRFSKVHSLPLDRGRKHYWHTSKRDYGICESMSTYYDIHQNPLQPISPHRRHSTLENHSNIKQRQETYDWRSAQKYKQYELNKQIKNDLFLISGNIDVHLPPIKLSLKQSKNFRADQVPKTKVQEPNLIPQRTQNQRQIYSNRVQNSIKTQPLYQYQRGRRKVKYSPTYICSTNNPLPTFKLYGANPVKPVYQFGYAEQKQL